MWKRDGGRDDVKRCWRRQRGKWKEGLEGYYEGSRTSGGEGMRKGGEVEKGKNTLVFFTANRQ